MTDFVPFARSGLSQSLPQRFEAQVASRPQALAVVASARRWTYRELNRRANAIAQHLVRLGGSGNEPVVVLIEQGAPLVAAILGALKAGKIYVPLDPLHPRRELGELVPDTGARFLLARAPSLETAHAVAPSGTQIFDVDVIGADPDATDLRLPIAPETPASIYFTSGTTGRAKGVLDTHLGILHNIMRYTNSLQIAPSDRLTLLQGPSFSGAISSLFAALLNGACSYPFDVPRDGGDAIAPFLAREGITVYHSVPSLFRRVAASGQAFPDLRLIRLEGDATSPRDIALFRGRFAPACRLVNGLGATECGLVRQFFVGPETEIPGNVVPIGYPVEDMDVVVLDKDGRELGPGETGEIVVRSRFLAVGYWRQPELTAAKFSEIDDSPRAASTLGVSSTPGVLSTPSASFTPGESSTSGEPPVPGARRATSTPPMRAYRTGDLGRLRSDGCLEHLGRADGSVRVRGQHVALADIEATLTALPDVAEAVVVATHDPQGETRLVAYVVGAEGHSLSVSRLRAELGTRLAGPMVPGRFVYVDRLPVNANGKIDREALPPPTQERPPQDAALVLPRNLLELQLASVWARLLELSPVGVNDSFFDLGGDSLLAVAMLTEVDNLLGRRAPPSALLETATIAHLASALAQEAHDLQASVVAVQPRGTRPPFFFLHGDYLSGGFFCAGLSRLLGDDQPFYALPPCGVDGGPVPPSYADMAQRHVAALREIAPRGPYRLGGLCNGGLVAFEMARLLEAQGERVDRLVLVAAVASTFELEWLRHLLDGVGSWQRLSADERRDRTVYVRDVLHSLRAEPWARRLLRFLEKASRHVKGPRRPMPESPTGSLPGNLLGRIYRRIDIEYVPGPYAGDLTLLWPREDPIPVATAARWWHRISREVEAHVIPGSHTTCLTTHADSAANVLRRLLDA